MSYALTMQNSWLSSSTINRVREFVNQKGSNNNLLCIKYINDYLCFKQQSFLRWTKRDGYYCATFIFESVQLELMERTKSNLHDAFCEEIEYMWEFYAKESTDNMTQNAVKIKDSLLKLCEEKNELD